MPKKDGTLYKYEKSILASYNRGGYTTLCGAYTRPSRAKISAYCWCEDLRRRLHGFSPRIPSANTFYFSYAFLYPDALTGEVRLYYDTGRKVYDFSIGGEYTNG